MRTGGILRFTVTPVLNQFTATKAVRISPTPEAPNRPTRFWSGFWPMLSVADAGFRADAVGYEFSLTVFSARRAFGGL